MLPAFKAENGDKKKEIMEKVASEAAPKTFKYLANLLEARGGENFAGNEVYSPKTKLFTPLYYISTTMKMGLLASNFSRLKNFTLDSFAAP